MLLRTLVLCSPLFAQANLQNQIAQLALETQGKVAIACALPGSKIDCSLNADAQPPMQSVFKLPLVVAAMHQIEKGKLKIDQPIRFLSTDRILPKTYSPLQDKYPQADVDVPLRELMRLSVSLSDNAAADTLLRVLGGPQKVDAYIRSLGVKGFHLKDNEATLHRDNKAQYQNWFQPRAAVQLLRLLADRSPLNAEHTALLFTWMTESPTGANRLKARLPKEAVFTHKTGTSSAAINDIGLITLPNGKRLAIAVFVSDFKTSPETVESVIARIGQAVYNEAIKQ